MKIVSSIPCIRAGLWVHGCIGGTKLETFVYALKRLMLKNTTNGDYKNWYMYNVNIPLDRTTPFRNDPFPSRGVNKGDVVL